MPIFKKIFKKTTIRSPLYVQIIFTISAFLLMVILSYIFMRNIVHKDLLQNTENIFITAETKFTSDLMEPQITLDGFARTVRNMIMRGDDADKLHEYFYEISSYMISGKENYPSFNGFLGYFETLPNGPAFIESPEWDRPENFNPSERQWYRDAIEANGKIAETIMYNDVIYKDIMLINTICLFDDKGRRLGVVGLRVRINPIGEYIVSTAEKKGGYGVLLSKNLIILAHPNNDYIFKSLFDPELTLSAIANDLSEGKDIIERPFISFKQEQAVAFFKRIENGWFLGVVIPKTPYYKSVTHMALILIILGSALALVLILVLIRVDRERDRADIENKHKTSFLTNMSHEIRTPMNAIIGMTDLLSYEQLSKRQMGFVTDIKASANTLLSIINDILDLSKIEAGKMALKPGNYNFHMLLDNIHSMFSYIAEKKGLEFFYELEGDIPHYLYGDDIRLKQVITNICGNAIKYTEKGYIKLKVTAADNQLMFQIKDSGIGIRKEDISKLFNTFQRLDSRRTHGIVGTGLGLSITKTFVEMMGGNILVESEYNQGSVFIVMIPIVLGEAVSDSEDDNSNNAITDEFVPLAPDAKILVVDDNEFNIKVAEGILSLFKITVDTSYSGKEAIEMIQNKEYDIVFMDHMMPGMDGIEATSEIRKLGGKCKRLPIIALTANAVEGAREMYLSCGFNGFISKPIDIHEMQQILKEWLPKDKMVEGKMNLFVEKPEEKTGSDFLDSLKKVKEINTEIGMRHVSGIEDMYHSAIELFYKKLSFKCNDMSDKLINGDMKGFSIGVHTMKSVLATIGAMDLSDIAAKLEAASNNNNVAFCEQVFPSFKDKLLTMNGKLSVVFPDISETEGKKKKGNNNYLMENTQKAIKAADNFERDPVLNIINDLLTFDFGDENNTHLKNAANAMKEFEFSEVIEQLKKIKGI
jgi:signal transduction histidine kinase/DNA-binding NarL/FixJ family response regulator/HPt (histidine-containing phosphotransfer) domain-containing protein